MRVQPAGRKSSKFERPNLRAAATSDRSTDGTAGPDPPPSDPTPIGNAAPAPPDGHADYALLAQQCRSRIDALAPRQRDVLAGLVAGYSNKRIAHMLGISPRTVEIYRAGMMGRLKVRTLAQALHIAFVAGLTPVDSMSLGSG